MRRAITTSTILAMLSISATAYAQTAVGIFSEIPGDPTAQVPGFATEFGRFYQPFVSPDGTHWILLAETIETSSVDKLLVVGSGPTAAGATTVIKEGEPAPWAPGELVGDFSSFSDGLIGINNAGQFAFSNNTDGPNDEYIVQFDGVNYNVIAQEGQPLPAPFATESYGSTLTSAQILADGTVGFNADSTAGALPTDQDEFLFLGNALIAQTGVTVPGNQLTGNSDPWDGFDSADFRVSADGAHYMIRGNLAGDSATDDVVVVDGNVVMQEGFPLPGSGFTSNADDFGVEIYMAHTGDWMLHGLNEDDVEWVVLNGSVVATSGDAVPGAADAYVEFRDIAVNGNGEYVFIATTDNPDTQLDEVLVYFDGNGSGEVLLRSGDAVDLDADGQLDDDAFLDVFDVDTGVLADDGWFYFTADLETGFGIPLGQAFLAIEVPSPACVGDITGNGIVDGGDLNILLSNWQCPDPTDDCQGSDLTGDGNVDGADLNILLSDFGCTN